MSCTEIKFLPIIALHCFGKHKKFSCVQKQCTHGSKSVKPRTKIKIYEPMKIGWL